MIAALAAPLHGVTIAVEAHDDCRARWAERLGDLSEAERIRLAAVSNPARALAFAAGRSCLRSALSRLIDPGCAPEDWTIEIGPDGKPRLGGRDAARGWSCSLAHAATVSMVALRPGAALGIDIEPVPAPGAPLPRPIGFTDRETATLDRLPAAIHARGFAAVWTVKEACAKRSGEGVGALETFDASEAIAAMAAGAETAGIARLSVRLAIMRLGPTEHAIALAT